LEAGQGAKSQVKKRLSCIKFYSRGSQNRNGD